MGEPTALDALVAEMLGDIGKLHDAVQGLNGALPRQAEEVEARIAGLIGMLQKTGDGYQEAVQKFTAAELDRCRVRIAQDGNEAIRQALGDVQRTVKTVLQAEIAGPMAAVQRAQRASIWQTLGLCLAAGLVGGLVVLAGIRYFA
jgi:hypothetical protein